MKVVVTAGPTREFIDPVRFISNRSTGRMGYAIASAFAGKGHEVTLISGPAALTRPDLVGMVEVVSAADMLDAVMAEFPVCDCLVMTAAVADWRPVRRSDSKMKKGTASMTIELEATRDILREVSAVRQSQILAGFAAETGDPSDEARRKLSAKGLDVIFANDVSASDSGFEVDTNRIVCITRDGSEEEWPLMTKKDAGLKIAEVVERLHDARNA